MWPRCAEHSDRGVGEHGRGHVCHVAIGQEDDTGQHRCYSCRRRGRRRSGPGGEPRSAHAPPSSLDARAASSPDGPLELRLVHLRATLDSLAPRLLVQLLPGAARPGPGASEDHPGDRTRCRPSTAGRRPRLAVTSAFLVDGASGDLLGDVLALTTCLAATSLMCSYWRARLLPFSTPLGGISAAYPDGRTSKPGSPVSGRRSSASSTVSQTGETSASCTSSRTRRTGLSPGTTNTTALPPPSRTGRRRTAREVRRCPRTSPRRGRRSSRSVASHHAEPVSEALRSERVELAVDSDARGSPSLSTITKLQFHCSSSPLPVARSRDSARSMTTSVPSSPRSIVRFVISAWISCNPSPGPVAPAARASRRCRRPGPVRDRR